MNFVSRSFATGAVITAVTMTVLGGALPAQSASGSTWQLYGKKVSGQPDKGEKLILTSGRQQAGLALNTKTTSLAAPITFRYRLEHRLQDRDQTEIADGSAFLLMNSTTPLPSKTWEPNGGGALGVGGLDGIAVIFDTWRNDKDPSDNFIAIVDTTKGFTSTDTGWLIGDQVWTDTVATNAPMDVFITVDRPRGTIDVGLAYDAAGPFASAPEISHRFYLHPETVGDDPKTDQAFLAPTIRPGLAAASGDIGGVHTVFSWQRPVPATPTGGLQDVLFDLIPDPSLPECKLADDFRRRNLASLRPAADSETVGGLPINTLPRTAEQARTVYFVSSYCKNPPGTPEDQSVFAIAERCSGTLISAELMLTAAHCVIGEEDEDFTDEFQARVALHRGRVVISPILVPAADAEATYIDRSLGACDANQVIFDGRRGNEYSKSSSDDVAVVKLTNCTHAAELASLGGVPIDTTAYQRLLQGGAIDGMFLGYPSDRPDLARVPEMAFVNDQIRGYSFPQLWQTIQPAILGEDERPSAQCRFPLPDNSCDRAVAFSKASVAGGGSGGPIFGDSTVANPQGYAVRPLISLASQSRTDWVTYRAYLNGPIFTEQMCNEIWAAARTRNLDPPTCLGSTTVPNAPSNVVASKKGDNGALVYWSRNYPDGEVLYTVTAQPGGRQCTTTSTSCVVTKLVPGTYYRFSVTASSPAGSSAAQAASEGVLINPVVGPVRSLKATALKGKIRFTWKAPSGLGGAGKVDRYEYRVGNGGWKSTKRTAVTIKVKSGTAVSIIVRAVAGGMRGESTAVTHKARSDLTGESRNSPREGSQISVP